jgi:hypothetical protein
MIGSGHSRSSFKMDTPAAKSCCELVGSLAVHMPVSAEARAVTSTHSPNIGLTRKTLRSKVSSTSPLVDLGTTANPTGDS